MQLQYGRNGYSIEKYIPLDEVNMSPATVPNIELPGSPQTGVSDAIIYSGNAVVQDIYTFESAAAADNNETSRQNATCLIIEGKYKGQTYFTELTLLMTTALPISAITCLC